MINVDIKYFYFYMHKNKINNKAYIGCTSQARPEFRWKNGHAYKTCTYFNNAILKYGWDNFEHIIIEEGFFTEQDASNREDYWINYYDTKNPKNGYNINSGGYKSVSPNASAKALEWMKEHPEFGLERVKEMHKWQKEHPIETYEMRKINAQKAANARKRPVVCVETGIIYESASEASRQVKGTTQSKITMCCKGQRATCGGFHWRYANE